MKTPDEVEEAMARAAGHRNLTEDEHKALKEVLDAWQIIKSWGRLGKIVLWLIVTLGATAAAIREMRAGSWFGG